MENVKVRRDMIASAIVAAWLGTLVVLNAGCKSSPQPPASSQTSSAAAGST
jgi:hypothetical protein